MYLMYISLQRLRKRPQQKGSIGDKRNILCTVSPPDELNPWSPSKAFIPDINFYVGDTDGIFSNINLLNSDIINKCKSSNM